MKWSTALPTWVSRQFHLPAFFPTFLAPDPPPNALAFSFLSFAFSALLILDLALTCVFSISLTAFCSLASLVPAFSFFSRKYE